MKRVCVVSLALILQISLFGADSASSKLATRSARSFVVPHARAFAAPQPVQVSAVNAGVVIIEQTATTTLEIDLRNPGDTPQEAEVLIPVPDNAVLRGFDFLGAAKEPTAKLLSREEARRTYDSIVAQVRDPALLEFAGFNLIRSSVFPVPAKGAQKVRITYEQLLIAEGNRVDYVLPRSEALEYNVPWTISVKIQAAGPISAVYSPTHEVQTIRSAANNVSVALGPLPRPLSHTGRGEVVAGGGNAASVEPGPFQLSYLKEGDGVSASLFAYPDPSIGGGYFLLLAGLPVRAADATHASPQRREVTLVIDTSGSMQGEKLEQVRAAALQVLNGLQVGEAFNLITYNNSVEKFAPAPVLKDEQTAAAAEKFIKGLSVYGGTNIYDALVEALQQPPTDTMLPLVLFLTDGLPTIGKTSEKQIRDLATKHNPHHRRIFTFGVGTDLNTPLLEKIASETRATASFVLPRENVAAKVDGVYRKLSGPVFADVKLDALNVPRISELSPAQLPDLFEGDQLVLLGRYSGAAPLQFNVSGSFFGVPRNFQFNFDLGRASTKNAFVPRLWATRKIEALVDDIRQAGADGTNAAAVSADPKLKKIVDEIVALSTQFGVLTEYTAFLALEGTDLNQKDAVLAEAAGNFQTRAYGNRSGAKSVNQEVNKQQWKVQQCLNHKNGFWDENMNRVEVSGVQQISDRTFYRRNGQWVDSRLVENAGNAKAAREIEFGSAAHKSLIAKLATQNRQACAALNGDVLLKDGGETVLIKAPAPRPAGMEVGAAVEDF